MFPGELESLENDEEYGANHINTENMVWKSSIYYLPMESLTPRWEDEAEEMTFRFIKYNEDDDQRLDVETIVSDEYYGEVE